MILLKWIKNNTHIFKEKMQLRNISEEKINEFFKKYDEYYLLENELNGLRHQKNIIENNKENSEIHKKLREKIKNLEQDFNNVNEQLKDLLLSFPNILDDTVPYGKNSHDNPMIYQWLEGHKPSGNKFHYDFINDNLINQVVAMSQSRFIGFNGDLAILHRAIGNFCLDFLKKEGFNEIVLPCILNYEGFKNSGHVPFFSDDLFWLENKKLGLIPTSEVTITNILKDINFQNNILPLKICSYSPCFRKEAGAAGKDTRGIIRLHQFHKVEMYMVTNQEESSNYHDYMASLVSKILKMLNLSHRQLLLCSGDTGHHSSKTYDFEVWMPIQNRWLEISSCSNVKDYQSINLKNKYLDKNEKHYTHTLNGSCLPIERTIASILENYQDENTIIVPRVLESYIHKTILNFNDNLI